MYIIGGEWDSIDKIFLFWSNTDGWVSKESATIFDLVKGHETFLPLGSKFIKAV